MSSEFQNIPGSVKAGGAVVGVGGLVALIWSYHNQVAALLIILIGVIVVIAAVIALSKVGALKMKGKSKSFKDELGSKLRATPGGVVDADARAKLDDLRRSLQSGMDKLQATGKNLYVLPWFLMVGEPGSGKTKAIAAAGVSLPGFQDPLQGAGGTVNMNWWFTNNGIILDTAGRLMLPEVNTGDNPEWDEFLRTLNRKRPNCPINGLILAVPADTLITDTATEIDRKAGDIAYQFNKLQVTLGIRFPVFVLITKSDKILGFREFFESVNQPDEQAQLLGWSNPEKLDDPFKPELVEEHLTKVHEQLVRRRARLIQDPVHTDDPNSRRLDQIDALYELPEAMVGLAPRLRRYLEPIFIAGPLSARPLFLRGIYFTSSLQTGEAVDAAMAAIMGEDIAKSHGGGEVSAKPYFLKHVFQEKVFKEKGLVTRTTNVSHLKRRRKIAVLTAAILSVLGLTGLTWFQNRQLKEYLGEHVSVWQGVEKWGKPEEMELVGTEDGYHGHNTAHNAYTLTQLHQRAMVEIPKPVDVPMVFKPVASFNDRDKPRREAYDAFFESKVLAPVVNIARNKLKDSDRDSWKDEATNALRQLILLDAKQPLSPTEGAPAGTVKEAFTLDGLMPYVLRGPNEEKYKLDLKAWEDDKAIWADHLHWVYSPSGGAAPWPPAALAGNPANGKAILVGVDNFIKHTEDLAAASKVQQEAIRTVALKLNALDQAELKLINLRPEIEAKGGDTWKDSKDCVAHWTAQRQTVDAARRELDEALKALETPKGWHQTSATDPGLAAYYQKLVQGSLSEQSKQFKDLYTAIPSDTHDDDLVKAAKMLNDARTKADVALADAAKDDCSTTLTALEKVMLCRLPGDGTPQRLYEVQSDIITWADKELPSDSPATQPVKDFAESFDGITSVFKTAGDKIERYRREVVAKDGREWKLCDLADSLDKRISEPRRKSILLADAVAKAPARPEDLIDALKEAKANANPPLPPIVIPITAGINETFPLVQNDPRLLKEVLKQWDAVMNRGGLAGSTRPPSIMDWDDLAKTGKEKDRIFKTVRNQFREYWTTRYLNDWAIRRNEKGEDWKEFQPTLAGLKADEINAALNAFIALRADALALVSPSQNPAPTGDGVPPIDPSLANKARQRLGNWATLSDNPSKARKALLALNDPDRADRYLIIPTQYPAAPPSPSYEEYWSHLFALAIESVGQSATARAKEAFDTLWDGYRRFPLVPPDDKETATRLEELSPKDLATACELIELVIPADGKAAGSAPQIGGLSDIDLFKVPMLRLRGEGDLPPEGPKLDWVKALRKVKPWLVALSDNGLKCRLSFLKMSGEASELAQFNSPYGQVQVGKTILVDSKKQALFNLRSFAYVGGAVVDVLPPDGLLIKGGLGPVVLALKPNEQAPVDDLITLGKGNWPQLRLIIEAGKETKDRTVTAVDAKNTWKVTYHHHNKDSTTDHNLDYKVTLTGPNAGDELPIDFWNK